MRAEWTCASSPSPNRATYGDLRAVARRVYHQELDLTDLDLTDLDLTEADLLALLGDQVRARVA